jgi:hypothetical protein
MSGLSRRTGLSCQREGAVTIFHTFLKLLYVGSNVCYMLLTGTVGGVRSLRTPSIVLELQELMFGKKSQIRKCTGIYKST